MLEFLEQKGISGKYVLLSFTGDMICYFVWMCSDPLYIIPTTFGMWVFVLISKIGIISEEQSCDVCI